MRKSPNSDTLKLAYLFGIVLGLTIVVYVLRGFALLTFLPGSVIWMLIFSSLVTGILYGIQKTRRY